MEREAGCGHAILAMTIIALLGMPGYYTLRALGTPEEPAFWLAIPVTLLMAVIVGGVLIFVWARPLLRNGVITLTILVGLSPFAGALVWVVHDMVNPQTYEQGVTRAAAEVKSCAGDSRFAVTSHRVDDWRETIRISYRPTHADKRSEAVPDGARFYASWYLYRWQNEPDPTLLDRSPATALERMRVQFAREHFGCCVGRLNNFMEPDALSQPLETLDRVGDDYWVFGCISFKDDRGMRQGYGWIPRSELRIERAFERGDPRVRDRVRPTGVPG